MSNMFHVGTPPLPVLERAVSRMPILMLMLLLLVRPIMMMLPRPLELMMVMMLLKPLALLVLLVSLVLRDLPAPFAPMVPLPPW